MTTLLQSPGEAGKRCKATTKSACAYACLPEIRAFYFIEHGTSKEFSAQPIQASRRSFTLSAK